MDVIQDPRCQRWGADGEGWMCFQGRLEIKEIVGRVELETILEINMRVGRVESK